MLTDRSIRDAKPKASVYQIRDDNIVCRGFGVAVAPEGAKGGGGTKTFFLPKLPLAVGILLGSSDYHLNIAFVFLRYIWRRP